MFCREAPAGGKVLPKMWEGDGVLSQEPGDRDHGTRKFSSGVCSRQSGIFRPCRLAHAARHLSCSYRADACVTGRQLAVVVRPRSKADMGKQRPAEAVPALPCSLCRLWRDSKKKLNVRGGVFPYIWRTHRVERGRAIRALCRVFFRASATLHTCP